MTRRPSVIGDNPLDAFLSPAHDISASKSSSAREPKNNPAKMAPKVKKIVETKERMTVQISADTVERVKDAVYWTPGLTVAKLTEEALNYTLDKLEKQRGEPFQKRASALKPGRPIK